MRSEEQKWLQSKSTVSWCLWYAELFNKRGDMPISNVYSWFYWSQLSCIQCSRQNKRCGILQLLFAVTCSSRTFGIMNLPAGKKGAWTCCVAINPQACRLHIWQIVSQTFGSTVPTPLSWGVGHGGCAHPRPAPLRCGTGGAGPRGPQSPCGSSGDARYPATTTWDDRSRTQLGIAIAATSRVASWHPTRDATWDAWPTFAAAPRDTRGSWRTARLARNAAPGHAGAAAAAGLVAGLGAPATAGVGEATRPWQTHGEEEGSTQAEGCLARLRREHLLWHNWGGGWGKDGVCHGPLVIFAKFVLNSFWPSSIIFPQSTVESS